MWATTAKKVMELERDEGRNEGLAEGQKNTAIETARRMKEKGLDIQLIAEITDLTKEEILGL